VERMIYFKNPDKFAREMKETISKLISHFEIYIFGSVIRGDYSPGLSDIDVAIVSNEFENREKKLQIYDLLFDRYFNSPFEFHLLTEKQWKFYRKFIGDDLKKI